MLRYARVSLAALFVAMTAAAVVFAVKSNYVRKMRQSVAEVVRLRGNVEYRHQYVDHQFVDADWPGPRLVRALVGDDYFAVPLHVDFTGVKTLRDDDIRIVTNLPELEMLSLAYTPLTDSGLAIAGGMPRLKALGLDGTSITPEGLRSIANATKTLEELTISNTVLADEVIPILESLPRLRYVDISNTRMTANGITALRQRRPELQVEGSW